jgi:hypothetical protein
MKRAVELEDAWLYQVPPRQVPVLAEAADKAATAEAQMEEYQADLDRWTHRPRGSGEGAPAETVTAQMRRPVRIRNFTAGGRTLLDPGCGDDRFAEFLILATTGDTPAAVARGRRSDKRGLAHRHLRRTGGICPERRRRDPRGPRARAPSA